MASLKLAVLLTAAAVVAFASSAVARSTYVVPGEKFREDDKKPISTPDFTDDEVEDDKKPFSYSDFTDYEVEDDKKPFSYSHFTDYEVEDDKKPISTSDFTNDEFEDDKKPIQIPDYTDYEYEDDKNVNYPEICALEFFEIENGEVELRCLTQEELDKWMEEDVHKLPDNSMTLKINSWWERLFAGMGDGDVATLSRHKRLAPNAPRLLSAGRALFKGAARAPKPAGSGSRITQQYTRPGNFQNANQHFNSFSPDHVKSFSKNGISGRTGTVGKHQVTVRDGSKQGSPTLEIRSPKSNVEYLREFRFEKSGKH